MNKILNSLNKFIDLAKHILDVLKVYFKDKTKKTLQYLEIFFEKYNYTIVKYLLYTFLIVFYLCINSWESLIIDFFKIDFNPLSDFITENHVIDLSLSILIFILLLVYFLLRINDHRYWSNIKTLAIVISLYPLISKSWNFTSSNIFPNFCYLKSLYFVLSFELLHAAFRYYNHRKKLSNRNYKSGFLIDSPIINIKSGQVDTNRKDYATQIVKRLLSTDLSKHAFAVGVIGSWGNGKSSFLSIIKRELPENSIIIDFNPWYSKSNDQVIVDFFDTLNGKLSKYNSSLSKGISEYVKALSDVINSGLLTKFSKIISIGKKNKDIKNLYENVSKEISKINKPIYIFIDDLDRLEKSEIMEVFRLIRNTACFNNTVFIVGYDREYIVEALNSLGIINSEQYLEKIFSVEVSLPVYEKNILVKELSDLLSNGIIKQNINPIIKFIKRTDETERDFLISHFLYNFRDVKRFVNIFSLNLNSFYPEKQNDIVPLELFCIELIRYRFYSLYKLLRDNPNSILELDLSKDRYILQTRKPENKFSSPYDKESLFQKINKYLSYDFKDEDKNTILSVLEGLFSILDRNQQNSICYFHNYAKYFAFRLLNYNLSIEEFKSAIISLDKFKEKIDSWVKDNKTSSVLTMIESYNIKSLSIEEFKIFFDGFIYFGNTISNKESLIRASKSFFQIELISEDSSKKDYILERMFSHSDIKLISLFIFFLRNLYIFQDEYDEDHSPDYIFDNTEIYKYIKQLFLKSLKTCDNVNLLFDGESIFSNILENCFISVFRYEELVNVNIVSKELIDFIKEQNDGSESLMKKFCIIDSYKDYEDKENAKKILADIGKYFNSKEKYKDLLRNCKDYNESKVQEYFEKMGINK